MLEVSEVSLCLEHTPEALRAAVAAALGLKSQDLDAVFTIKRAIDARKKSAVQFTYVVDVLLKDPGQESALLAALPPTGGVRIRQAPRREYQFQHQAKNSKPSWRPVIVGTGPCGLFCGLLLARAGWNPILLERGKPAGPRARDVTAFWRRGGEFLPESNVQFGEGGAGTFSDGKLYTQIRDREQRIPFLLQEMVKAGAPEDILLKARPHIGTDRLIRVVRHIREEIQQLGGEVWFETRFERLLLDADKCVAGIIYQRAGAPFEEFPTPCLILAVGHSARDTFETLHTQGVHMEAKPLSIGVRVEHPQAWIDQSQYGGFAGHAKLGAAPYKFVHHEPKSKKTAYSFCMCPGGLVVAASSEPGAVVTNGMSSYARAESNANAGFMVDISPEDYREYGSHALAGISFQRHLEQLAFKIGGGNYFAPIQKIGDFLANRPTQALGQVKPSYQPGVTPCDLRALLPKKVASVLQAAIPQIERTLRGFSHPEALLTAVETRSSSPVRLTRHEETLESVSTPGLLPAGEGAGYAGGIISAAADGMRIAERLLHGPLASLA